MVNEMSQINLFFNILNADKSLKMSRFKEYLKKTSLRLIAKSADAGDYATALQLTYNFREVMDEKYRRNQFEKRLSSESLLSLEMSLHHLHMKQLKEQELNLIDMLKNSFPKDLIELQNAVLDAIDNYGVDNKAFKDLYNTIRLQNSIQPFVKSALITRLMIEFIQVKEKLQYADFIIKRLH